MAKLLLLAFLSHSDSTDVCSLLSFDAEQCIQNIGCGYCVDEYKCVQLAPVNASETDACVTSGMVIRKSTKGLGNCFNLFSDDGCTSCVSFSTSYKCGWCQSLGICAEVSLSGESNLSCPGNDWLINKRRCDKSSCASKKLQSTCKTPCRWSARRQLCVLPRSLEETSEQEKKQMLEVWISKRLFMLAGVGLIMLCFCASVAATWHYTKPLFEQLPNMSGELNLDDLPPLPADKSANLNLSNI